MKRVAESQLTKDNVEEEDDSQEPTAGIQKADPASLSTRRIRSLPKRGLSAAPPTTSDTPLIESSNGATEKSPEPPSRFGGFKGFGSSTASAFTFTPPASDTNTNVPQPSKTTSVSTGKPFQLAPTPQPSKLFSFVPTSNPTPPSTPPSISEAQTRRDAANKYCLSLRGLNTSLLGAITQAIQTNPFVDITESMEKYKSLRSSIQKTFDDETSLFGSHQTSAAVPAMAPSLSKSTPSMPALPRSSFGLGNDTRTTSSQLHASGFTPKLDYAGTEPPSSSFTRPNMARTSEQPISFGTETVSSGNASSSGMETSAVLATPLGPRTTVLIPSNDDTGSTGFTPENSFNGHDAIKRKDVSSSPFNFKPSTPAVPLTPGFSSFLGSSKPSDNLEDSSTPHPHFKSTSSNPSPPSPSGFGFGTGKNSSTSKPLSFGKGSIGNPVGFAFGSPAATPDEVKPPDTSDTSQDTGLKGGSEATDGALLSTSSHDPSPAPSQGSTYDADGPGEEDEVTLHEIKAHAYKMVSAGDAKNWVSAGKGQLKLKRRDGIKRRLLMRNSSTGHIILNFNLFPGFQAKIDGNKKVISFSVPDEDKTATVYQLRVPNEAEAVSWQQVIQTEVDSLLPSHDT